MASKDHGTRGRGGKSAKPSGAKRSARRAVSWIDDEKLSGERCKVQVERAVDGLGGPEVVQVASSDGRALEPPQWGEAAYLVRRALLLTTPIAFERVRATLGINEQTQPGETPVPGVVTIPVANALAALRRLAEAEGPVLPVAPEHVVHITPGSGITWCPATEPLAPGRSTPVPSTRRAKGCAGRGVKVAVIDTGYDHGVAAKTPWLAGVGGDQEPIAQPMGPYVGHGTFAAGVLRCVAPETEVYVHGVFGDLGSQWEMDLVAKIIDVAAGRPDIISLSAGTTTWQNQGLFAFDQWWPQYAPKGTVLVAAAGNNGNTVPFYPAAARYAVGVGATDAAGALAAYSNRGAWVDLYARGSDLVNAYPIGTYHYAEPPMAGHPDLPLPHGLARWSGTSFSTPLVSAVIAARMSWSSETPVAAAQSILDLARKHNRPGVGAFVAPDLGCDRRRGCCC